MSRTSLAAFLGVALIGSILFGWSLFAAEPTTAEKAPGEFAGKIIVFNLKSSAEFGAILESPQIRRLAGRDFFVGKQVDDGRPEVWSHDLVSWIAVDEVAFMTQLDSLEQFKKRFGEQNK